MKVLHSWLMEFIGAPLSADDVCAKLTRLGLNIEGVTKTGASFTGVVVGRIKTIEKHPNADKLSLCEVEDGSACLKVVCGAKNIAVGQKIPFARVGAVLSAGVLKKAKIRGVESCGMICSAAELGLEGYDNSGIMVLPDEAAVGADAAALFSRPDHVLEVEITPNLAYCLSHYALARELCAFYGLPFKAPEVPEFRPVPASGGVPITIEDPALCPRYTGVVVSGASAAPTPEWIAGRLRAMGSNPKNNILIDVSNYVMYELGQPAHCFDLARLEGPEINVRPAKTGEIIRSLDDQDIVLDPSMLVIADRARPAALAGVIGGAGTAVSASTSDILIESASFDPSAVRSSSKKSGVRTESSYRFERGTDPEMTAFAARRMAQLILAAEPGAKVVQFSDNYPGKHEARIVEADPDRINAILGSDIPEKDIFSCLKALQPDIGESRPWRFSVPSYRRDIETIWDMAEEVARYTGYDVIPSRSGLKVMGASEAPSYSVVSGLKKKLAGLGFSEVCNYDFVSAKELKACMLSEAEAVALKNPLSLDFQYLRPSMLPSLLKTFKFNLNRGRTSIFIFEIGSVHSRTPNGHREGTVCAGLMHGPFPSDGFWRGGCLPADIYHLKGVMDGVFAGAGGSRYEKPKVAPACFEHGSCLEMRSGAALAGYIGRLSEEAARANDIKDGNVYYFELFVKPLCAAYKPEYWARIPKIRPVSSFPAAWRDLSVVLSDKFEWSDIEREVAGAPDLASVGLIDVYRGKNIGESMKSLTIRFVFSSLDRTLTDAEINSHMNAVLGKLTLNFGARLRG